MGLYFLYSSFNIQNKQKLYPLFSFLFYLSYTTKITKTKKIPGPFFSQRSFQLPQKNNQHGYKKLDKSEPKLGIPEELKSLLKTDIALQFWQADEQLYATTPMAYEFYKRMRGLSFLKTGLHVAQRGKKAWTPAYDMVYSFPLHWELPVKELDYATALEFLNGQSQHWVAEAGFYYMKYNNQPIGMIKQIGTRYNNLHPTEWRIRHLPK